MSPDLPSQSRDEDKPNDFKIGKASPSWCKEITVVTISRRLDANECVFKSQALYDWSNDQCWHFSGRIIVYLFLSYVLLLFRLTASKMLHDKQTKRGSKSTHITSLCENSIQWEVQELVVSYCLWAGCHDRWCCSCPPNNQKPISSWFLNARKHLFISHHSSLQLWPNFPVCLTVWNFAIYFKCLSNCTGWGSATGRVCNSMCHLFISHPLIYTVNVNSTQVPVG